MGHVLIILSLWDIITHIVSRHATARCANSGITKLPLLVLTEPQRQSCMFMWINWRSLVACSEGQENTVL